MATRVPIPFLRSDPSDRVEAPARPKSDSRSTLSLVFYTLEFAVAAVLFAHFVPNLTGSLFLLALLIGLNLASELVPINIYGKSNISVGFVFTTAIMALYGPAGVLVAAPIEAAFDGVIITKRSPRSIIHMMAMYGISYTAGALVFATISGTPPEAFTWGLLAAALAAAPIVFVVNASLMSSEIRIRTGQRILDFWEQHGWIAPNFLILGVVGAGVTGAYLAMGMLGIFVFVAPGVMMRLSMKLYVDKTRENVAKLEEQNEALLTANVEIQRVSDELRTSYDGTLEALVNALDARDQETKGHSIRVSRYMMDIAREMGVKEDTKQWVDMQRGSLLHDVGKIGVSDTILLKPGKLTDDEWTLMRQHPEIGYNMLRQVKFLQGPAEIILAHHERWDGKGYPKGLHEDEIPLGARIFTVVDTFDSMTSDRPYRKALSTLESMNEILRCSGTQFDPRVVEAFLDIYEKWVEEREEMHSISAAA